MKKIYLILVFLLAIASTSFSQTGFVINEFDYDQPAGDTAEYIELYNGTANAIDVGNYSIVLVNGNNNTPYDTIQMPSFLLNPSSFYVICGNGGFVPLCNMVLSANINIIQNGAPDAIALVLNSSGSIVDVVSYEGTVAAPYFETTGVDTSKADPSITALIGLSRFPDGQDSQDNNADFNLACITPGTPNTNVNTGCVNPLSKEKHNPGLLKIYPNPSQGSVIVDFSAMKQKDATLTLHDILGKSVKTIDVKTMASYYHLDLSEFQNGMYYLTVKSDAGSSTQRIMLRK